MRTGLVGMTPVPVLILDACERVEASAATVLVRLAGTWSAPEPTVLGAAVLELVGADGAQRFPALPDRWAEPLAATPGGERWRAAFPLPRAVAELDATLVLRVAGAPPVPLGPALLAALDRAAAADAR